MIRLKGDKLNLGSGLSPLKGWVNLDFKKFKGVDIVHDLNKFPYPFSDNQFKEIMMKNVLEHLDDISRVMEEVWRISKNGGIIHVWVPHFSGLSAVTDPTHKRFFSSFSMDFFEKGNFHYLNKFTKANFKIIKKEIRFSENRFLRVFNFLVNSNRKFYERFLAYIFPSQGIFFKLRVVK